MLQRRALEGKECALPSTRWAGQGKPAPGIYLPPQQTVSGCGSWQNTGKFQQLKLPVTWSGDVTRDVDSQSLTSCRKDFTTQVQVILRIRLLKLGTVKQRKDKIEEARS